jgi:murein DD-endopeptidase MepM/ murein hydrolase activator NlpD
MARPPEWIFSQLNSPKQAADVFAKAMRDGLRPGHSEGPNFFAKVLTTPVALNSRQMSAIFRTEMPTDALTGPTANIKVRVIFNGRIESQHNKIPDPCDITYAKKPLRAKRWTRLHTQFIADFTELTMPLPGDIVKVQLQPGTSGQWDLQYGYCVGAYQQGTSSDPEKTRCWSPMAAFRRGAALAHIGGARALTLDEGICEEETPDFYLIHPLQQDVTITSPFGYRMHPIKNEMTHHHGIDFSAPQDTPIYAAADGTISEISYQGSGAGYYVSIKHTGAGQGYTTSYMHMVKESTMIKKGQSIKSGELIGYVGNTGASTATHLHFEIIHSGDPAAVSGRVDPIPYIKTLQKCTSESAPAAVKAPVNPTGTDADQNNSSSGA